MTDLTNYSSFVDGDLVQWTTGTNSIALAANATYAYGFGRDASGSGWAGLGNASGSPYAGGQLALVPASGGALTFGASYAATFKIRLARGAAAWKFSPGRICLWSKRTILHLPPLPSHRGS